MKTTRAANLVNRVLPLVFAACEAPRRRRRGGVTAALARVLQHLERENTITVTDLAARLGVTPSTASLSLDRLEEKGWAVREEDPHDGRRVLVRLTEAGVRTGEESGPLDPGRVTALVERLSPGGRKKAVRGLKELAEAADAIQRERVRSLSWGRRRAAWKPPPPVPGVGGGESP